MSCCEMNVPPSIDLISLQFFLLKCYDYGKIDGGLEWEGLVEEGMGKGNEGENKRKACKIKSHNER